MLNSLQSLFMIEVTSALILKHTQTACVLARLAATKTEGGGGGGASRPAGGCPNEA